MSAKARATTCAVTSCCASRSPSARWPAQSPPPSPAPLANRPGPQQAGQERNRREQRPAPLPRFELDAGARVAVDLPRDVVGAPGEGEAGLGEAQHRERLAFDTPPRPAGLAAWSGRKRGDRRATEALVSFRIRIDHRASAPA